MCLGCILKKLGEYKLKFKFIYDLEKVQIAGLNKAIWEIALLSPLILVARLGSYKLFFSLICSTWYGCYFCMSKVSFILFHLHSLIMPLPLRIVIFSIMVDVLGLVKFPLYITVHITAQIMV